MGISIRTDPNLDTDVGNIQNSPNDPGMANFFRKMIRGAYKGKDVGGMRFLDPIAQDYGRAANQSEREINENPELADQPELRTRLATLGKQRIMDQKGDAMSQGLADQQQQWFGNYSSERQNYMDRELQKRMGVASARQGGTHYFQQQSPWAQVGLAALSGAGALAGGLGGKPPGGAPAA